MITMTTKSSISIISQFFYGNRTGVEIECDWVDHFLRGQLSRELYGAKDIQDVVRKTVRVPGSENIVVVYDQTQEDEYVNKKFPAIYAKDGESYRERWGEELKMHVSCEIPEIDFKIHTRCFACRMNTAGEFEDIQDEDYSIIARYFPSK